MPDVNLFVFFYTCSFPSSARFHLAPVPGKIQFRLCLPLISDKQVESVVSIAVEACRFSFSNHV